MSTFLNDETPDAEVYYSQILISTNAVAISELPSYDLFELYDEFHEICISLRSSRYTQLTASIGSIGSAFISRVRHIKRLTQMLARLVIYAEQLMLLHIPETTGGVTNTAAVYAILLSGMAPEGASGISDAIPTTDDTPGDHFVPHLDPNSATAVTYRGFLSDFHEVKRETRGILEDPDATTGSRTELADKLWNTWALVYHITNTFMTSGAMDLSPSLKTCRGRICRAVALFRQRLAAYVAYISIVES